MPVSIERTWGGEFLDIGGAVVNLKHPEFGAVGDGVADDTAALTAFFAALDGQPGFMPAGIYRFNAQMLLTNLRGLVLRGAGLDRTVLSWFGNATDDALRIESCLDCLFEGFTIKPESGSMLKVAIRVIQGATGWPSSHNTFRKVGADGVDDDMEKGFVVGGAGVDANNDFHLFDQCPVENYTIAGFELANSQVFDVTFRNCRVRAAGAATVASGVLCTSGNFHWFGGFMGLNAVDFHIEGPNGASYTVDAVNSEASERFLTTGGPAGSHMPLSIRDVRYSSLSLHADGFAIKYQMLGPLLIEGGQIGDDITKPLSIFYNPGGADILARQHEIRNTVIVSSLTTLAGVANLLPTQWDFRVANVIPGTTLSFRDRFADAQLVNVASVAAGTTLVETYTVVGVAFGDQVIVSPVGGSLESGLVIAFARGNDVDEIAVGWANITASAIDPAERTLRFDIIKNRDMIY